MRAHLGGRGKSPYLTNAINDHDRENLVCAILLAGIKQQEELGSAEIDGYQVSRLLGTPEEGI
jgi:hypothetical protein